jgi:flagellar motor switch protein FliN
MPETLNYFRCWVTVAKSLFSQALAGEPALLEVAVAQQSDTAQAASLPAMFGFVASIAGEEQGQFLVMLDSRLRSAALLGDGADQKAGWGELLREVAEAASGELLARGGKKCHVSSFAEIPEGGSETFARSGFASHRLRLDGQQTSWSIQLHDGLETTARNADGDAQSVSPGASKTGTADVEASEGRASKLSPGFQLLLDVELEASLRFGSREMPLSEILDLGPGDVVQLDRHIADPVDLIVGDRIVARGEVVLINGNFGLRVTEVAEPQKRLETIRCLF